MEVNKDTYHAFAYKLFLVYKITIDVPEEFIRNSQQDEYIATVILSYMSKYVKKGGIIEPLSAEDMSNVRRLCDIYCHDIRIANQLYNNNDPTIYKQPTFEYNSIYEPIREILQLTINACEFVKFAFHLHVDIRTLTARTSLEKILLDGIDMYRNQLIKLQTPTQIAEENISSINDINELTKLLKRAIKDRNKANNRIDIITTQIEILRDNSNTNLQAEWTPFHLEPTSITKDK